MATTMQPSSNLSSNYYGEDAAFKVNILASCYIVDSAASLKGIHYSTTGVTGAECPPLAALTSSNELALLPKQKKRDPFTGGSRRGGRRGGAALSIREECERFFCEPMATVFLGERTRSIHGSVLTGASASYLQTPPPDYQFQVPDLHSNGHSLQPSTPQQQQQHKPPAYYAEAWMEIWDYAGGASFRAFVANNGKEKTLFVFFDIEGALGRDLKKALMALIDLADGPLGCSRVVTCLDRRMVKEEAIELTKSLQWVGFELTTLDHWANRLDATSPRWVFMGMEM